MKLLTPKERHRTTFGALHDVIGALVAASGGSIEVAGGKWWGLALVAFAAFEVREAYLKYRVGNWP